MRYLYILTLSLFLAGCANTTSMQEESLPPSQEQSEQQIESPAEAERDYGIEAEEQEVEAENEEGPEPSTATNDEQETGEQPAPTQSSTEAQSSEPAEPQVEEEVVEEEVVEEEVVEEENVEEAEPEPTGFTLAMVQENDDASSCWSVINGNVYDLTAWINQHPGGSSRILGLCGTDGSSSFNAIHRGQSNPESRLQSFLLGPLS